ncbi:hypothetical protein F4782DRAFT_479036 [Xylaria castorea]|nr:hypothetical protein F4782DRAFT_479036 [Xylaria castorea]
MSTILPSSPASDGYYYNNSTVGDWYWLSPDQFDFSFLGALSPALQIYLIAYIDWYIRPSHLGIKPSAAFWFWVFFFLVIFYFPGRISSRSLFCHCLASCESYMY